ncbi:hypothetical protein [Shimia sp.]|uniref:hypothetical protein n=1 Tax=Shimia sp. TaxID=1954381 RepID=UPI0032991B08
MTPEQIEQLPFFVTGPGETDVFQIVVAVFLIVLVLSFGAIYFTIQSIPDRMAGGANKVQLQIIGLLGLLSLFSMNNIYWVAALLLAAIPINEVIAPFKSWEQSRSHSAQKEDSHD